MDDAQAAPEVRDAGHHAAQAVLGDLPAGERVAQLRLPVDDLAPDLARVVDRLDVDPPDHRLLLRGEADLAGDIQQMPRPGVVVELGGVGEPHPLSGQQGRDLLGGEGLARSAGGLRRRREGEREQREQEGHGQGFSPHLSRPRSPG